jgi:riboflavin biosynthesis pyrimidine reductase
MTNTDSRVTIHMAASLDGFIARKDGSVTPWTSPVPTTSPAQRLRTSLQRVRNSSRRTWRSASTVTGAVSGDRVARMAALMSVC